MVYSTKIKSKGGLRELGKTYGFKPITRNRDEKGHILTYSVKSNSGAIMEFNTLKEAKIFALKI